MGGGSGCINLDVSYVVGKMGLGPPAVKETLWVVRMSMQTWLHRTGPWAALICQVGTFLQFLSFPGMRQQLIQPWQCQAAGHAPVLFVSRLPFSCQCNPPAPY